MSKSKIDLSIIIVNWNTCDLLADCLTSIFTTTGDLSLEAWVVDNASHDGSVAMMRTRFPQVHIIENRMNVGFAAANNQAIPQTTSPFILLLNSDTLVQPDALQEIVAFMQKNSRAGIVGANVINADGSPQRCFGKFPTLLSESVYAWGLDSRFSFDLPPVMNGQAIATDWVLGAALTARREALLQVDLLDPGYFMYSEEIDLCYRVKRAGWDNFVLPSARIVHLGGESTKQTAAVMKAQLFRSKVRYFQKHHGTVTANVMYMMFGASILGRRLVYRVLGRNRASELWTQAWSYYTNSTREQVVG
jgi:hypothetical protein